MIYFELEPYRDVEAQLRTWEIDQHSEWVKNIPQDGTYLEIGTKYGGSAYLARCLRPDIKIHSIDPNALLYMFKGHENEVGIDFIKGYSVEVAKEWEEPIDLLFIDGDHGEVVPTAPWDDFVAWEKFVPKGGIIIMHDYHFDYPDVVKACDKILKDERFELIFKPKELANRQDTSMFIIRKK